MGRDRGAAAANAAAADAAAAALVAAAAATKVAADAGDMTQFLAATKAAAAIAAALVTCQAATRQIGQTAASNTAAHRRGGYRPPRGPGARPGPRHRRAATGTARSAETTQTRTGGGRPPRAHSRREKEEGDSTGRMERHGAETDRKRQTGGDATSDPSGSTQFNQPRRWPGSVWLEPCNAPCRRSNAGQGRVNCRCLRGTSTRCLLSRNLNNHQEFELG